MKNRLAKAFAVGVGGPLIALAVSVSLATPASAKPDGTGPCSTECGVGASGQGGVAGNAQGEYFTGPARVPDTTVTFAGPADSGRLELSGALEGALTGHIHDDGALTGHMTGDVSPDGSTCSGRCALEE